MRWRNTAGRSDIGRRRVIMNGIYTVMKLTLPGYDGRRQEGGGHGALKLWNPEAACGNGEEAYRDIIRDCR